MKLLKFGSIVLSSVGLIFLGACSNANQATNPNNSPVVTNSPDSVVQSSNAANSDSSSHAAVPQAGGHVVESGNYHLEFVPEPEANGTHMDFYLQKGNNHEAIPNAKVTAQVQMPDGTQKTIPLTYDAGGKNYTALLPGNVAGQYQVKFTSDINGEKVDGRFSFNQ